MSYNFQYGPPKGNMGQMGPIPGSTSEILSPTFGVPQADYASPAVGGGFAPQGSGNFMGLDTPFFSSVDKNGVGTQGWGGTALGAASGLFNAWMGMKQYGLAKDQLSESKKQFGLNYDAQRQTTNASLEDRQRARITAAGGAGAYQSVGDYMAQNGIKPRG